MHTKECRNIVRSVLKSRGLPARREDWGRSVVTRVHTPAGSLPVTLSVDPDAEALTVTGFLPGRYSAGEWNEVVRIVDYWNGCPCMRGAFFVLRPEEGRVGCSVFYSFAGEPLSEILVLDGLEMVSRWLRDLHGVLAMTFASGGRRS